MIELRDIDKSRPDATFDLDGTVFKMTVLESYTEWLSSQGVFDSLPSEVKDAKQIWKNENTEHNYAYHLGSLVRFFIEQVPGKSVSQLSEAANIVADQQRHRRWNITTEIIDTVRTSHNISAISLMPEWLMEPFVRDLGFVALIGSTYVARDGLYTDEAHTINKAVEYLKLREDDAGQLDIHMGDTSGDSSLFDLANRPTLFNPSWTLYSENQDKNATIITSHKDMVTVINQANESGPATATLWGAPFDVEAILREVRSKRI